MKKLLPIIVVIAVLVGGYFLLSMNYQNGALPLKQNVNKSWANVETAYQRRSELIPNLVRAVEGAANFEKSTLEAVINARAKASKTTIDPTNLTPEKLQEFQQAQAGVSSALSRLLVTVERYPELKSNQNFLRFQDDLTSTENQILTARTRYNESVETYNGYVLKIPNKFFLSNYPELPFFKAKEGADVAPEVEFNFGS